ncbi:MAG: 4-(cytidine 5'-diphospho)-2-C-methyl-D-erythritol kinase [Alphaproteobacteria bacterium]|nr:4-(cytidine 5'-diphospho)-2-C-methyl-D-erythritol kinase [Alphaproteobacteria bacterium]
MGPGTDPAREIPATAKLNLTLHVTGRRADGYHTLDGLTVFCTLADRVRVIPGGERDRVIVDGPFAGHITGPELAEATVRAFRDRFGPLPRVEIRITKRIPVAAGLGGGSADAAAVLRALAALCPVPPDRGALHRLALELGADVPACLDGVPVRVRGIGECLVPLGPLPPLPVVLVNPGVALPTGQVFRQREGGYSRCEPLPPEPLDAEGLFRYLGERANNDLIGAACAVAPVVATVLETLADAQEPRCHGMSGSGATCFGLFDEGAHEGARALAERLASHGWWSSAATLASRTTA